MNKWLKYFARAVAGVVILVLLSWIVIYIYFIANKKSIVAEVTASLGESMNGKILVGDVGLDFLSTFPYMSLSLKDVAVRDSLFDQHKHEFLRIRNLYIRSNPVSLFKGRVEITRIVADSGRLFIYTDSTGYSNKYLLVTKKSKTVDTGQQQNMRLPFEELKLKDMDLNLLDESKHKLFGVFIDKLTGTVDKADSMLKVDVKMRALIRSLAFNLSKGSYAEQKPIIGDFTVFVNKQYLKFDDIRLNIGNEPLDVSGSFHLKGDKEYQLHIGSASSDFENAKKLLTPVLREKMSLYHLAKPLNFFVDINGHTDKSEEPVLSIKCFTENNLVTTGIASFAKASFKGEYSSKAKDSVSAPEDVMKITDFSGEWQGIPVTSREMIFDNLKNPTLHADINADCDLTALNNLLGSETFLFNKGSISTHVQYYGPLSDTTKMVPAIKGSMVISGGEILYGPRQVSLTDCNGNIVFDNQDVFIKDLKAKAQGNSVLINVAAKNVVALMQQNPDKVALDCNVYSPQLDINTLRNLLSQRKSVSTSKKQAQTKRIGQEISDIMDKCTMRCVAKVDKMVFKKFVATNVQAQAVLTNTQYTLQNVSFSHAGGNMTLKGYSRDAPKNSSDVQLNVQMNKVDVSQVFYAFDNFGMESLNSKSLHGKLTASIALNAALNSKTDLVPEATRGQVYLSLKQGALVDFQPLQDMSFFLLKKRDFSNIEFAELKDSLKINGQQITINRMEIQSTVLSLFVEGLFDLKGPATNLQVQVPLSNLKKRKPDYQPENKGVDAKTGLSVFVTAKGNEQGKIDFSYSLSNKVEKKKKRERRAEKLAAAADSTELKQ